MKYIIECSAGPVENPSHWTIEVEAGDVRGALRQLEHDLDFIADHVESVNPKEGEL